MISNFSYCRRAISTALDRIAVLARGRAKRWVTIGAGSRRQFDRSLECHIMNATRGT